jgi:hypothetical protein
MRSLRSVTLHAHRTPRRDLERRDRFLGPRDHRLLAGNCGQIVLRALDLLLIGRAFARADIQHDLFDARRLQQFL